MQKIEQVTIPALGYELAADWYEGATDRVLFCLVGYTSNKKNHRDIVSAIVEATGCSALVLDYTGHGESPFDLNDISPAQNFIDVITAFDWLMQNYPNKKVDVMGTSYGGFLATQLTKYRTFQNLVLRVPAIYRPEAFYTKWGQRLKDEAEYIRQERTFREDAEALAKHPLLVRARQRFTGKTLVVVHELDELVPVPTTDAYIKAFQADTYLAKNFYHGYRIEAPKADRAAYQQFISDWLQKAAAK